MTSTPDQRLRIFVSSTLSELAPERAAAREAIESLHLTPILFELGARPHPPRDLYRAYVQQSHVFVGIYWESYGWMAPGMETSGLEDEYLASEDLPKLIYVKLPAPNRDEGLRRMLAHIRQDGISYKKFSTAEELRTLVADDLALLLTERFQMGSLAPDAQGDPDVKVAALPLQTTPLIGRRLEVEDVKDLVADPDVRLVTLTGPGGIGKTRLALEVANQVDAELRDGIRLVPLASVGDPELFVPTLASSLGILETTRASALDQLVEFLARRELLLLLDNFEHLVAAAPVLADLLMVCPDLKVLVTSRAVLRLRGEREYAVPPLSLPTHRDGGDVHRLETSEAVALFVERARSARPDFELTSDNAQAVAEICSRLDGLPLAIELAAARSRLLPPEAMLSRMSSRLELLTGGPRDLPDRQRTLRNALDWDYDLLGRWEQIGFRRLAVFAGGFTLDAAEKVVPSEDEPHLDVFGVVESLLTKSLLRQVTEDAGVEPRFAMLKTIREYGLDRLRTAREEDHVRRRHALYFLAFARRCASHFRGPDQVRWLDALERGHENLRAALLWAGTADAELLLELCGALAGYWEIRSYLSEGRRWLTQALQHDAHVPPPLEADALDAAGVLARGQGDYDAAIGFLEQAIALRRTLGDDLALGASIKNLGNVYLDRTDFDRATALYEESLEIRRRIGDRRGVAETLNNLGVIADRHDDWDRAAGLYEQSLELFKVFGDKQGEARVLMNLGEARLEQGDHAAAYDLLRESLQICWEIGSRWDVADLLELMGAASVARGDAPQGARLLGAGRALRDVLGTPLPDSEVPAYEKRLSAARAALDPEVFSAAWEQGRSMNVEDAIAHALHRDSNRTQL